MRSGVIIGVDVGQARVGVARCDADGIMAVPVTTLKRSRYGEDINALADIVTDYAADLVVVGLPRLMGGGAGEATRMAIDYAHELAGIISPPIRMVDERLTSVSAHRSLSEAGRSTRTHRSVVDQQAAVIMVEQALLTIRRTGSLPGIPLADVSTGGDRKSVV